MIVDLDGVDLDGADEMSLIWCSPSHARSITLRKTPARRFCHRRAIGQNLTNFGGPFQR
jgi:hypothetical protein